MTVKVDGAKLRIRDVVGVARPGPDGRFRKAALAPEARERIKATRDYIDRTWMHDDAPLMYAFNTGVGLFKDQRVHIVDMAAYQTKTVYAHATGVGEPFSEDVTRAMMLLRANAFASNYSGPQVELVERLIAFLNAGLHPVIPQKGSVGASGDLAPLAHMAGAVCGFAEAEMIYKGRRMPAREAIAEAGFEAQYQAAMDAAAQMYEKLYAFDPDVAQYVVPNGFKRRVLAQFNLREAYAFCQLRSAANAHFSIRRIAQRVHEEIARVHPLLAKHMKMHDETWEGVEEGYFTKV